MINNAYGRQPDPNFENPDRFGTLNDRAFENEGLQNEMGRQSRGQERERGDPMRRSSKSKLNWE